MTYRLQFADAKSLNYADPAKLTNTLRVISNVGPKTIKGVTTLNNRLEVVSNDTAPITEGDKTVDEAQSIRTTISGAIVNNAALAAKWEIHKANVDAAIADGALKGFLATSAVMVSTI